MELSLTEVTEEKKMKKFLAFLTVLGLFSMANFAHATACGTTTVSSTGLIDTDGFTWSNGTYVANLVFPQALTR